MKRRLLALSLCATVSPAAANIDIVLDYSTDSSGFFSSQARRSTLDAAAASFEARITDTLAAITPGTGANSYTLSATNPSGGAPIALVNQPIAANEIRIFIGARDIGSAGFSSSGYSVGGSQTFIDSVVSRGEPGVLASPPSDYAPWGGSITFDSSVAWHDGPASAVPADRFDLYSIAVHEMAHLFGIGQSGAWDAQRSNLLFLGPNAAAVFGGPVPLADDSHFASGVRSPIDGAGSFETALDPEIQNGVRKPLTDLDWAALQDVGWQVTPIPEPHTWALMLGGLALVLRTVQRARSNRHSASDCPA
jgi:hypothetical protein